MLLLLLSTIFKNTIYIHKNFLKENNSYTYEAKEGYYIGFNSDYELDERNKKL